MVLFFSVSAQYTFEMMNGRMLEVFEYNDSAYIDIKYVYDKNSLKNARLRQHNEQLKYRLADEKGDGLSKSEFDALLDEKMKPLAEPRKKEAFVPKEEVFAVHHPDGTKKYFYELSLETGNDYTLREMQEFIWGERDAIMNYRAKGAFWGGVAFGAVGGFAWQNSIFSITTPVVWTLGTAIPVIRIRERYMSDPTLKTNPYRVGFARTARSRTMIQGLKGSAIGTVAGVLIYAVLSNNVNGLR